MQQWRHGAVILFSQVRGCLAVCVVFQRLAQRYCRLDHSTFTYFDQIATREIRIKR